MSWGVGGAGSRERSMQGPQAQAPPPPSLHLEAWCLLENAPHRADEAPPRPELAVGFLHKADRGDTWEVWGTDYSCAMKTAFPFEVRPDGCIRAAGRMVQGCFVACTLVKCQQHPHIHFTGRPRGRKHGCCCCHRGMQRDLGSRRRGPGADSTSSVILKAGARVGLR